MGVSWSEGRTIINTQYSQLTWNIKRDQKKIHKSKMMTNLARKIDHCRDKSCLWTWPPSWQCWCATSLYTEKRGHKGTSINTVTLSSRCPLWVLFSSLEAVIKTWAIIACNYLKQIEFKSTNAENLGLVVFPPSTFSQRQILIIWYLLLSSIVNTFFSPAFVPPC